MSEKFLTVLVVPHDERNVRRLRLSYARARVLVGAGLVLVAGLLAAGASWGRLASRAARVELLQRENERLEAENALVGEIAANLERTEDAYRRIRIMAGLPEQPASAPVATVSTIGGADEEALPAELRGRPGPAPSGWPLTIRGFVTARFTGTEGHTGVDIAVPLETRVVATADGTVKQTGSDSVFGVFVVLAHEDGFETMYAHNANILVEGGEQVSRGQTIAVSGNSGHSSAPHLHYEVRRVGRPVDPTPFLR